MSSAEDTNQVREECEAQFNEGTGHVKFGFGVGAVSAASLLLIGTTCPLCYFVAPAMVAVGVKKRRDAKKRLAEVAPDLTINWPKPV